MEETYVADELKYCEVWTIKGLNSPACTRCLRQLPALIKLSKNVNTFKRDIKKSFFDDLQKQNDDIIKIMPCVEGDRSDCQPEVSSIARSRRLRAMVVVEG